MLESQYITYINPSWELYSITAVIFILFIYMLFSERIDLFIFERKEHMRKQKLNDRDARHEAWLASMKEKDSQKWISANKIEEKTMSNQIIRKTLVIHLDLIDELERITGARVTAIETYCSDWEMPECTVSIKICRKSEKKVDRLFESGDFLLPNGLFQFKPVSANSDVLDDDNPVGECRIVFRASLGENKS